MSQQPATLSSAYKSFPAPILQSRNGFDFHVYYMPTNPVHVKHVAALHQAIKREFPEVRQIELAADIVIFLQFISFPSIRSTTSP
ncbi:hypothetical protein ID866_4416 [Astraeus odoratus]|nr:hypothetical protein ID866_4416 [Astraeus odoratus]